MNSKIKGIGFLLLFFIIVITAFIVIFKLGNRQSERDEKRRLAIIGNVQFKGKVINSKVYDYAGKSYYMICVQLDTCNVKSFYVLNDLCALKIKNNIATLSAGVYDPYEGAVKIVEVNVNNNGKIKYHYKNGDIHEFKLVLANSGLTEKEMSFCN